MFGESFLFLVRKSVYFTFFECVLGLSRGKHLMVISDR